MYDFRSSLIVSLTVALFFALVTTACAAPLTLDPAKTMIVIRGDAELVETWAAATLREQLRRVYRTDEGFDILVEVLANRESEDKVSLELNPADFVDERLKTLRADGYILQRKGNRIIMAGPSPESAMYAAVEFLDRCADVRFYMPTDRFTSLPDRKSVSVDELDISSEPFVTSLYFSGIDSDDNPAVRWVRHIGGWRRKGGTHQHNVFYIFHPKRYAERYPDLYPIYDGQRHIPESNRDQSWQPNFLSPHSVEAAIESAKLHFEKRPHDAYLAVSLNDGGRWDQSDAMNAVVDKYRNPDDRYWHHRATSAIYWQYIAKLGEEFAKHFPDKKLVALAYGPTRFPPEQKLPSNIVPFTNFHIAEMPSDGFISTEPRDTPTVHDWLKVCDFYANHDWYHGGGYQLPRTYTGYWQTFLQALQGEVDETYQHVECYTHYGFAGPKLYLLSKLMWDPGADTDLLLTQFCDDMFGSASPHMKQYWLGLEKLWHQLNNIEGPERKLHRWGTQFVTTEKSRAIIAECRAHLDAALKAVDDETDRDRVEFFSDSFAYSELLFRLANAPVITESEFEEATAWANQFVEKHPMALRYPKRPAMVIKALYWESIKRARQWLPLKVMPTPTIDGKINDDEWAAAEGPFKFIIKGGGKDHQKTQIRISRNPEGLFLAVTCPRIDEREFIESEQSHWRSDNIELFFNLDDGTRKQMWIQTTGRVVDWTGRKDKKQYDLQGAIVKSEDAYTVELAIPWDYIGISPSAESQFQLQVLRNEFSEVGGGRNEVSYCSIFARRIRFQ